MKDIFGDGDYLTLFKELRAVNKGNRRLNAKLRKEREQQKALRNQIESPHQMQLRVARLYRSMARNANFLLDFYTRGQTSGEAFDLAWKDFAEVKAKLEEAGEDLLV